MQAEGDIVRFPREAEPPSDFTAFFAEEHRGLFKALYFVTGNKADAQELMQHPFLTLWERLVTIDRSTIPPATSSRTARRAACGSRTRCPVEGRKVDDGG